MPAAAATTELEPCERAPHRIHGETCSRGNDVCRACLARWQDEDEQRALALDAQRRAS